MIQIQWCDVFIGICAVIVIIILILIIDKMLQAWDEEDKTEEDFLDD